MKQSKYKTFQRKLICSATAAGLLAASGMASASLRDLGVDYTCEYPLIGVQPLRIDGTVDVPDTITVGEETEGFDIVVLATLQGLTWTGMSIVSAQTLEGNATMITSVVAPGRTDIVTVIAQIEQQSVPPENIPNTFTLDIFSTAPSLDPYASENVGTANIALEPGMTMEILARKADGSPVIFAESDPATGIFPVTCDTNAGATLTLGTTEIEDIIIIIEDFPEIDVDPSSLELNLGTVLSGLTSVDTVTVSNIGDADLSIDSVQLIGGDAGDFMQTNDCSIVSAGDSCEIEITYFATGDQTHSTELEIMSNDADEPSTLVSISGTSEEQTEPELSASALSVSFGTVNVGSSSDSTVTISNVGTAAMSVTSINVSGSDFSETNDCGTVLVGDDCTVDITFMPSDAGASNGSLSITSDGGDATVALSGSGFIPCTVDCNTGIVNVSFDLVGDTFIIHAKGGADLAGTIESAMDLAAGTFTADLVLNPTVGNFPLLGTWLGTASAIEFEQVGQTYGTLSGGILVTNSEMYTLLPDIYLTIFSLNIRIGGGDDCRTKETSIVNLVSTEGEWFDPLQTGGTVSGTYTLSDVENCGLFGFLVSNIMAGEGNTISLTLTPNL